MKPPAQAPRTASRKQARRSGNRTNSATRRPKRLINKENAHTKKGTVLISPEVVGLENRASLKSSPSSVLTPPSFNLSYGSELNDEVLLCLDRLDGNLAACSTPLAQVQRHSSHALSRVSISSAQLFDFSSPREAKASLTSSTPLFGNSDLPSSNWSSFLTTPAKNVKNNLLLSNWGLPEKALEQYAQRGITSMFEWQAECLMMPNVLTGGNLVYSAPTSAGKTLVAELLALKCVLELRKKVIIILPFVSIAHEKSNYLHQILEPVGVKVGGFMGSQSPSGSFTAIDIAICTIEKANSLVNRLLEENVTDQLGVVIVDELHMIGDSHRGYLLELLLTKLMYVAKKHQPQMQEPQSSSDHVTTSIQLIGMSATLPNLDMLANWLDAQLYHTDFRPVPLMEMVKIGPTVYNTDFKKITEYDGSESLPGDEDDILLLCRERVSAGHSVLIFCPTKAWCENLSSTLAGALAGLTKCQDERGNPAVSLDMSALIGVCEQLRKTQVGLDRVLEKTVPYGVAFHHAGLTFEEREIIEGSFRSFQIKILVATSTLSSGVNLPARLVIVRTPFFQRSILDVLVYKQMVGRAGRKGVDDSGESILICKESERSKVVGLLKSAPKPVQSCLGLSEKSGAKGSEEKNLSAMKRAILEVVVSGSATNTAEIETYISCTLLCAEMNQKSVTPQDSAAKKQSATATNNAGQLVQSTIKFLLENEFIAVRQKTNDHHNKDQPKNTKNDQDHPANNEGQPSSESTDQNQEYYATQLGTATVASALSPEEALVVFSELRKARRCFVLENELHIIYLVTPVYIQNQWPNIDWYKYLCLWERLPPSMKHIGDILGVKESFLTKAIQGRVPERTLAQKESLRIHRRFFTALALHDLVHEVPIIHVARRYGATKGLLQTLQSAAGTFAGMVTVFCNRLGWKNLELLLSQFQSRLLFGVERELCDLVKISLLNGFRARVLYNAGFHTIAALATANPIAVETCLRNALPFKSYKHTGSEESCEDRDPSEVCTTWCAKLKKGLSESAAARMIVQEAQMVLSEELNVPISAWNGAQPPSTNVAALANKPVMKNSEVKTRSVQIENHAAKRSLAEGIAALRGHRGSPNAEETNTTTKKPCVESQTHTLKTLESACQVSADCEVQCPNFIPASSLLRDSSTKSVSAESRPLPFKTQATSETVHKNSVVFSPILIQPEKSKITTSPLHPMPSFSPVADIKNTGEKKSSTDVNSQPADANISLTIPDSLPCSMDMSMSFSFHTFEMIDAACNAQASSANAPGTVEPSVSFALDIKPEDLDSQSMELFQNISHTTEAEIAKDIKYGKTENATKCGKTQTTHTKCDSLYPESSVEAPKSKNLTTKTPARVPGKTKFDTPKSKTPAKIAETPPSSMSLSQINSLKELSSLCSSQLSQSGVTIIDVTTNKTLFETFVSECIEQESVSFSVATSSVDQGNGIGSTIVKPREATGITLPFQNEQVMGVAFCWGDMDVYYVSLCNASTQGKESSNISLTARVKAVRKIFLEHANREKLIAYDIKKHTRFLALSCDVMPMGKTLDPIVANWMLDPDAKEKTIHKMVLQYLPDQPLLSEDEDYDEMPLSSLATHSTDPQMRCSAESILAFLLMSKLEPLLKEGGLYQPFVEVEMPSVIVLAKIELNGIGFSPDECGNQRDILQSRVSELERSAYMLARHTFSLTSPEDVAQVLFVELKLPSGQDNSSKQAKTLGPNTRRASKKRVQHLSTAKDVLEKIKALHPLPGIVLEWRRISSTMTKMVYPLFKEAVTHDKIHSVRIHPSVQFHTATGRVSVSDPNLQMVPKEFDIGSERSNINSQVDTLLSDSQYLQEADQTSDRCEAIPSSVCMRNAFQPFRGGVFLAADYSQLELRMLAHMSGDSKLKKFLNSDGDGFKMIAGEWLGVPASEISDKQRQEAKQVCYGMLYGIGSKALGEQLGIEQEDAAQFIETFKSKYPTMKKFLNKTVQDCKEKGFVCTLLGRKRFLPSIHSTNIHARSQAERQAVNTTIQGSAADLVKTAMVNIDKKLRAKYPHSPNSLTYHNSPLPPLRDDGAIKLSGAYLVLQLHDELLYEVAAQDLKVVARIVKREMENALEMSVKFPVKMKSGYAWGQLESYSI